MAAKPISPVIEVSAAGEFAPKVAAPNRADRAATLQAVSALGSEAARAALVRSIRPFSWLGVYSAQSCRRLKSSTCWTKSRT
jgi:hypothetical protein